MAISKTKNSNDGRHEVVALIVCGPEMPFHEVHQKGNRVRIKRVADLGGTLPALT